VCRGLQWDYLSEILPHPTATKTSGISRGVGQVAVDPASYIEDTAFESGQGTGYPVTFPSFPQFLSVHTETVP
jgi:hypothetical protein